MNKERFSDELEGKFLDKKALKLDAVKKELMEATEVALTLRDSRRRSSSQMVATGVCENEGHKLVALKLPDLPSLVICEKCGMTLDEIKAKPEVKETGR